MSRTAQTRSLAWLVVADLVTLFVWLGIVVGMQATHGTFSTFDDAFAFVLERHWLFYDVSYANAVLLTLLTAAVYAGLYALLKRDMPVWAAVGFAFVPVYAILALFAYLSQLVIVPSLLELASDAETVDVATVLLSQLVQAWPESSLQYLDQFSYFILGIPSFIYGIGLWRMGSPLRASGGLFIATGPFSLVIGIGVVTGWTSAVGIASMAAGVLTIVAEIALAYGLFRAARAEGAYATVDSRQGR